MDQKEVTVHVFIEVKIRVDLPVMRAPETQVADFIEPALADLQEATADVLSISQKYTEIWP